VAIGVQILKWMWLFEEGKEVSEKVAEEINYIRLLDMIIVKARRSNVGGIPWHIPH